MIISHVCIKGKTPAQGSEKFPAYWIKSWPNSLSFPMLLQLPSQQQNPPGKPLSRLPSPIHQPFPKVLFESVPVLLQLTVLRSKQLTSKIIFQNKPICKLQLFWKKCYFISGKRINVGESAPNISASQSTEFNNGHIVGT